MSSTADERRQVADQILQQLGGREFLTMTGCKNLAYDANSLRMRLSRNISGANILKITLRGDDLYEMVFTYYRNGSFRVKNGKVYEQQEVCREVKRYEGVYDTMLRPIFTEVTGLETRIPRVIGINAPEEGER